MSANGSFSIQNSPKGQKAAQKKWDFMLVAL